MGHEFSLSTSWNISRYSNAEDYIRELDEMGFNKIEVNYEVSQKFVKDIMPYVEGGRLEVTSVHNICPAPEGYRNVDSTLPLSSTNEEIRKLTVSLSKNTLDIAHSFNARVVVLHTGEVDGIVQFNDTLRDMFSRGEEKTLKFAEIRNEIIKERRDRKSPNVNACENSIYELSDYIYKKGYNIKLGLENRDRYHQIPIMEEYELWFDKLKQYPIGLWYDIGHGEVHRNVFLESCVPILERYKDRILGFHIHDTDGIYDHYAPGMKKTRFELLKKYLNLDVIKVLELKPYVSKQDVNKGVVFLKEKLQ
jgi:sugar phosphate isomerase/epimerase